MSERLPDAMVPAVCGTAFVPVAASPALINACRGLQRVEAAGGKLHGRQAIVPGGQGLVH